jgi:hypothetical protein
MIKSTKKVDGKIKTCPYSLSSEEISGNDRAKALESKKTFDNKHQGKTGRLVKIGEGKWKEIWE